MSFILDALKKSEAERQQQSGAELAVLGGHECPVRGVAYSPDGRSITSGDHEAVRVWEFELASVWVWE